MIWISEVSWENWDYWNKKIKSCAFTRKCHQNEKSRLPYRLQTAVKGCFLHYWTRDFKFCVVTGIAKVRSKSTLRFMLRSSLTAQVLDDHGSVVINHSNHITEEEDPSKLRCLRWNTFRFSFFCSLSESFFPPPARWAGGSVSGRKWEGARGRCLLSSPGGKPGGGRTGAGKLYRVPVSWMAVSGERWQVREDSLCRKRWALCIKHLH